MCNPGPAVIGSKIPIVGSMIPGPDQKKVPDPVAPVRVDSNINGEVFAVRQMSSIGAICKSISGQSCVVHVCVIVVIHPNELMMLSSIVTDWPKVRPSTVNVLPSRIPV